MKHLHLTAAIKKEKLSGGEDVYVALCLELDIAGQGFSIEQAKHSLREAVELFLETASPSELDRRLPNGGDSSEVFTTPLEVLYHELPSAKLLSAFAVAKG